MTTLPTNRTTLNTPFEHVDDHNELHRLHNLLDPGVVLSHPGFTGPPTTGVHVAGEVFVDNTGVLYVCQTSGTPGTWGYGGSGVELASADQDTDQTGIGTSQTDITALAITFVAPARAFEVRLWLYSVVLSNAAYYATLNIVDPANVLVAQGFMGPSTTAVTQPCTISSRLPRTGASAYAITPGNTYTFKATIAASAGTLTVGTNIGRSRPRLLAITL